MANTLVHLMNLSGFVSENHVDELGEPNHRKVVNFSYMSVGTVLKNGVDTIKVSWGLNPTFPAGTDSGFKTVKVKLCYAPISQKQRAWRKIDYLISKDRACQFVVIINRAYDSAKSAPVSFEEVIKRNVPTATYFVRAYVL